MEDTVTSMVWPRLAKGGSTAESETAATFFSLTLRFGGTVTPNLDSMLLRDCTVKGICWVLSPVPERPTTRP